MCNTVDCNTVDCIVNLGLVFLRELHEVSMRFAWKMLTHEKIVLLWCDWKGFKEISDCFILLRSHIWHSILVLVIHIVRQCCYSQDQLYTENNACDILAIHMVSWIPENNTWHDVQLEKTNTCWCGILGTDRLSWLLKNNTCWHSILVVHRVSWTPLSCGSTSQTCRTQTTSRTLRWSIAASPPTPFPAGSVPIRKGLLPRE